MSGPVSASKPPASSPDIMPTGNLPSWTLIHNEDFLTDFAVGQFRTVMGSTWDTYNTFPDSSDLGTYRLDKTASVASSVLTIHCYKEAGQSTAWVGAPTPWNGTPQLYGRYEYRFRTTPTTNSDFKMAWLLWPATNQWVDGEIDFPELTLGGNIGGFSHNVTGTPSANVLAYGGSISSQAWHRAAIEWTPASVRFLVDSAQVAITTNSFLTGPAPMFSSTGSRSGLIPRSSNCALLSLTNMEVRYGRWDHRCWSPRRAGPHSWFRTTIGAPTHRS
jgi:hypothetical protein